MVTLSSSSTKVSSVLASVTVLEGSPAVTFTVNTNSLTITATASIKATFNRSQSATLAVTPPSIGLSPIALNPTSVVGVSSIPLDL